METIKDGDITRVIFKPTLDQIQDDLFERGEVMITIIATPNTSTSLLGANSDVTWTIDFTEFACGVTSQIELVTDPWVSSEPHVFTALGQKE